MSFSSGARGAPLTAPTILKILSNLASRTRYVSMANKLSRSRIHSPCLQPRSLAPQRSRVDQQPRCARCFSQSTAKLGEPTTLRKNFWRWMNNTGHNFRDPRPSSTNYLGAYDRFGKLVVQRNESPQSQPSEASADDGQAGDDISSSNDSSNQFTDPRELRPFPLNPDFRSEAVLSESLRDEIYNQVVTQGRTVREVSANLHVDMRRVGAVVRLKTIELDWMKQGKALAKPYQKAVLDMIPQTHFKHGSPIRAHESINDLPVHPATTTQLFHPTSESRHFTREDAGRVFDPDLLSADERIPHPELIEKEKDRLEGMPARQRDERHKLRLQQDTIDREEQKRLAKEAEDKITTIVQGRRWNFRFKEVNAESVGKDGRAPGGVGWRYGMPLEDRKRGKVTIPTSVP